MKSHGLKNAAVVFAAAVFSLAAFSAWVAADGGVSSEGGVSLPANIPMSAQAWGAWRTGITNFVLSRQFDPERFSKLLPEAASLDSNFSQGRYLAWHLAQSPDFFRRTASFLKIMDFKPEDLQTDGKASDLFYDTVAKTREIARAVAAYYKEAAKGKKRATDPASFDPNRKLGNWGSAFPYFFNTVEREEIEKLSGRRIWTRSEAHAATQKITAEAQTTSQALPGAERAPALRPAQDPKQTPPVAADAASMPGAAPLAPVTLSFYVKKGGLSESARTDSDRAPTTISGESMRFLAQLPPDLARSIKVVSLPGPNDTPFTDRPRQLQNPNKRSLDESLIEIADFKLIKNDFVATVMSRIGDFEKDYLHPSRHNVLENWLTADIDLADSFIQFALVRAIRNMEKKSADPQFKKQSEAKKWDIFEANFKKSLFSFNIVEDYIRDEKSRTDHDKVWKLLKDKKGRIYFTDLLIIIRRAITDTTASNNDLFLDLRKWMFAHHVLEEPLFTAPRPASSPAFEPGMPGLDPGTGGGIGPDISDPYADIP